MGQKIHPTGFRLAVTRNWSSRWYANSKNFGATLGEDIRVREYLKRKLSHASVARITIERPAKNARITMANWRSRVKVIGVVTPSPVGVAMLKLRYPAPPAPSAAEHAALWTTRVVFIALANFVTVSTFRE